MKRGLRCQKEIWTQTLRFCHPTSSGHSGDPAADQSRTPQTAQRRCLCPASVPAGRVLCTQRTLLHITGSRHLHTLGCLHRVGGQWSWQAEGRERSPICPDHHTAGNTSPVAEGGGFCVHVWVTGTLVSLGAIACPRLDTGEAGTVFTGWRTWSAPRFQAQAPAPRTGSAPTSASG